MRHLFCLLALLFAAPPSLAAEVRSLSVQTGRGKSAAFVLAGSDDSQQLLVLVVASGVMLRTLNTSRRERLKLEAKQRRLYATGAEDEQEASGGKEVGQAE